MNTSIQRIPKQVTKAPSGAAVSSPLIQLLKNEIRASILLSKSFRANGERRVAFQFLNDADLARRELMGLINAIN